MLETEPTGQSGSTAETGGDGAYRGNGVGRMGKVQGLPSAGAPSSREKMFKNNFPVTVKIRTSGYQTLECFIATLPTWGVYGRLVHVGENFNRLILQILGCELHKMAAGLCPGPLGEL